MKWAKLVYTKQNDINGCEYTNDKMAAGFILFTVLVPFPRPFFST